MINKEKFLTIAIIVTFSASLISISEFIDSLGFFLIPMIGFTFTACMLFLIFEKHILTNFKQYALKGFAAGLLFTAFLFSAMFSLKFLSFNLAFVSIFSAAITVRSIMRGDVNFKLILPVIALILVFFSNTGHSMSLLVNIIIFVSAFLIEAFSIYFMKDAFKLLRTASKDMLFYITLTVSLISIVLFFINKPQSAPMLSTVEQTHFAVFVYIAIFISSIIISLFPKTSDIGNFSLITGFFLSSVILSVKDFSLLFVCASLLILTFLIMNERSIKKGFSVTEVIAIIALSAIIASLIFPLYGKIKKDIIICLDKQKYSDNMQNKIENVYMIGNIMIKSFDSKPYCIYHASNGKIKAYTIE